MGHARIAFIRGHPNQTASALRYDGFHAAMTAAGLTIDPALIQQGYFTYRSGLEATETLLTRKNPPTAIFASNHDMAAAAVSVAYRRGLDVPRSLRRRFRRHSYCDDRLAGAHHRPTADCRHGWFCHRTAVAYYPPAQGRRRANCFRPRHGPCPDQARFRCSAVQGMTRGLQVV